MCGNCNVTYYGKTERHFEVRLSEHLCLSPLTGKRVSNFKPSTVSDHLLLSCHDSDINDLSILTNANNGFKLLIKESLLISRDSPVLNRNCHLFLYNYLINIL